jgi:hypothetical protein
MLVWLRGQNVISREFGVEMWFWKFEGVFYNLCEVWIDWVLVLGLFKC